MGGDSIIHVDDCWNRFGVWSQGEERCPKLERVIHCRNCDVYSRAGRQLLNRPLSQGHLEALRKSLALTPQKTQEKGKSVLVFRIGGEWLAISLDIVREVAEISTIHSIPHCHHPFVLGIVNIRGKLETCISLENIVEASPETCNTREKGFVSPRRFIVLERDDSRFVFPCQEVKGIVRYKKDALEECPVHISKSKSSFTSNIFRLHGIDIGLLDHVRLFDFMKGATT